MSKQELLTQNAPLHTAIAHSRQKMLLSLGES